MDPEGCLFPCLVKAPAAASNPLAPLCWLDLLLEDPFQQLRSTPPGAIRSRPLRTLLKRNLLPHIGHHRLPCPIRDPHQARAKRHLSRRKGSEQEHPALWDLFLLQYSPVSNQSSLPPMARSLPKLTGDRSRRCRSPILHRLLSLWRVCLTKASIWDHRIPCTIELCLSPM